MFSLNKKKIPSYMYKFNIALATFFVIWITVGVVVMITISCIYGDLIITWVIIASTIVGYLIGLFIFWLVDNKLHKRLIEQRTAELEKKFYEMPFEEAESILKEKGIITNEGFVVKDGKVVPFEDGWLSLSFKFVSQISIDIVLYDEDDEEAGKYEFDNAMYNFFKGKDTDLKDDPTFNLLVNDKREFTKQALRYTKTLRPDFTRYR